MPDPPQSQYLCPSDDLVENQIREAEIRLDGRPVFLIVTRLGGRPRAWLNICPHQGRNLNFAPDKFLRDDQGRLVCAAHGAVFELGGGRCVSGPCRGEQLQAVALSEQGDSVYLNIQGTSISSPGQ